MECYVADENGAAFCMDSFCECEIDSCVCALSRVDEMPRRMRDGDRFNSPEPPPVMIAPFPSILIDDAVVIEDW